MYCTTSIGVGTGGGGGLGPLTFLFEGAQYVRGPLTFEKLRPIFELIVTPYFQSLFHLKCTTNHRVVNF